MKIQCFVSFTVQVRKPKSRSQNHIVLGDFRGGPVVKTLRFHRKGAQVQSLVRELRSHMLRGVAKKKCLILKI